MILKDFLKKIRNGADTAINYKRKIWDSESDYKVSFLRKALIVSKGLTVAEWMMHKAQGNDISEYLTEWERLKSRDLVNGEYKLLLDDRLLFEEIFSHYIKTPEIYAYTDNGHIYWLHDNQYASLSELVDSKSRVVVKPLGGGGGKDVYLIDRQLVTPPPICAGYACA